MPFDYRKYTYDHWRASAKQRGIVVRMSFEQWWGVWEPAWNQREHVRMMRRDTKKPYTVENVFLSGFKQVPNRFLTGKKERKVSESLEKSDFMHRFHGPL